MAGATMSLVLGCPSIAPRAIAAEPDAVFKIWPNETPPGETRVRGEEGILQGRRRPFYQLTNISTPTVSVFRPAAAKRTGAAVLVCPGGGLQRLAYEHEGLEIADWLNPLGLTVFVLKYRVPAPSETGLMDAQRAMGLIRSRAGEFEIDADRISVMGFSAGGEIAVLLATRSGARAYETIDAADAISSRPDNVCLVYPGGIARRDGLREDIASRLDGRTTPPMFIVHAFHDASTNSLALASELKKARVPCEVHIYQEGGHGFGARDTGLPLNSWKTSYLAWLRAFGFFDSPFVAEYARRFGKALKDGGALPRLGAEHAEATLADGLAAQKRVVMNGLSADALAGFKGGASTEAAQRALGISQPLTGILFRAGRIDAGAPTVVDISGSPDAVIETEIGFLISRGVDLSYRLTSVEHTKGAVDAVVPVIELPDNYARRMGAPLTAIDLLAANVGSSRFIVGEKRVSPDDVDPDDVTIRFTREDALLHETSGGIVRGGQWVNLMTLLNQMVDQGYTPRSGDLIICGALGKVHPAAPGRYAADYGPLGTIEFEMR